jgi:prevent-host-death family protein
MDVTVHQAKTRLSELLKRAAEGEPITILRRGIPVAKLVPLPPTGTRELGWDFGEVNETALRPWPGGTIPGILYAKHYPTLDSSPFCTLSVPRRSARNR